MNQTISFIEYAALRGVAVMTAYRHARDGRLGPVILGHRGRRLVVAELIARGLLQPEDLTPQEEPTLAEALAPVRKHIEILERFLLRAIDAIPDQRVQIALYHEYFRAKAER